MRNLNEEMALFSIKIERIKQTAHDKLSALQDELSQPTEKEIERKSEDGLLGLFGLTQDPMKQYALLQASNSNIRRDEQWKRAATGRLQTGWDANQL